MYYRGSKRGLFLTSYFLHAEIWNDYVSFREHQNRRICFARGHICAYIYSIPIIVVHSKFLAYYRDNFWHSKIALFYISILTFVSKTYIHISLRLISNFLNLESTFNIIMSVLEIFIKTWTREKLFVKLFMKLSTRQI